MVFGRRGFTEEEEDEVQEGRKVWWRLLYVASVRVGARAANFVGRR